MDPSVRERTIDRVETNIDLSSRTRVHTYVCKAYSRRRVHNAMSEAHQCKPTLRTRACNLHNSLEGLRVPSVSVYNTRRERERDASYYTRAQKLVPCSRRFALAPSPSRVYQNRAEGRCVHTISRKSLSAAEGSLYACVYRSCIPGIRRNACLSSLRKFHNTARKKADFPGIGIRSQILPCPLIQADPSRERESEYNGRRTTSSSFLQSHADIVE